jgi:hypothetical protein
VEAPIALAPSLPDNRRNFCEAKSRLYFAIKDINNAGRACTLAIRKARPNSI